MAWIFRTPKSPYLQARYLDENGKLRDRTTKTTDCDLALRMANGWEMLARAVREKLFSKAKYKEVSMMMCQMITGEPWKSETVEDLAESFVHDAEKSKAPETTISRAQTMKLFCDYLKERKL